jgi:hypothetical protein
VSAWGFDADGPRETPEPTSLADFVAGLTGWRIRGRHGRGPCPCCDSSTGGWVGVAPDGGLRVGCHACGDWKALRTAFGLDEGDTRRRPRFAPPKPWRQRGNAPDLMADADALDRVYRAFLRHLPMTADQRRNVLGRDRGLSPELRSKLPPLLAPVPTDPTAWRHVHRGLVDDLRVVAPDEFLARVPELERREGNGYAVLPWRRDARYFEPWADEEGRIVALRAYMGKLAKPRYLTSEGRTGPLVHFAFGVPRDQIASVPWVFTEGWVKAEVLAHQLRCVAVGFPGVSARSSWPRAMEVLQRLAPDAPTYVAFDSEVWMNRLDLAVFELELARMIQLTTGRDAGFAVWDAALDADGKPEPKGIDDALVAGGTVRLVDRKAFATVIGPLVETWERAHAA